jgi:hypothetical protein
MGETDQGQRKYGGTFDQKITNEPVTGNQRQHNPPDPSTMTE